MTTEEHYPGQRLSWKSQLCTVRYVGPVSDKPGIWLGVEWDDAVRGKHGGEYNGKKYFECRSHSRTAASFLKPHQQWDPPRTFYQALREKYMPEDAGTGGEIVYFSSKQAEEVGFEKFAKRQAALQGIKTIVLDRMRIRCHDLQAEKEVVLESCKDIMELDLGSNLFETLDEIRKLVALLPKLRALVLDGNRFSIGGQSSNTSMTLDRIASLGLSDTLLRWGEISETCKTFPGITSLAAASNDLSNISSDYIPSGLRDLDLSGNSFTSLSDLAYLHKCPNLQTLILKHNPISQTHSSATPTTVLNRTVQDLDLAHASIASFSFFDTLATSYPSLLHLRVAGNPIYTTILSAEGKPLTAEDGYMLTIARLPQLRTLNYSKITEKERLNADTYYLRQISAQIAAAPPASKADILAQHPRWRALCEEYGEPTAATNISMTATDAINPHSLAARLVNVTFTFEPSQTWLDTIPKSFNIYSVHGIAGKKLGIMPLHLRLIWETGEADSSGEKSGYEGVEWWASSDEEEVEEEKAVQESGRRREVELVPGTNALGTYVGEEREVRIRVERR